MGLGAAAIEISVASSPPVFAGSDSGLTLSTVAVPRRRCNYRFAPARTQVAIQLGNRGAYWMLWIFQYVLCDGVLFEQRGNKMTGAKLVGIEMAAWEREDSDKTFN